MQVHRQTILPCDVCIHVHVRAAKDLTPPVQVHLHVYPAIPLQGPTTVTKASMHQTVIAATKHVTAYAQTNPASLPGCFKLLTESDANH